MKPTLLTLFILDLRLEHKEIHSISPLFLGIKESQGNVSVKTKEEEMRVKTKDERENLNRNPEFLILSNWIESKKEINDPERKDRFILLTNSLIHSPYLNSLFIKELGKAFVSEFAYFTYSGLNELFFLCRNNQNNLGFLIWSYFWNSAGPLILKFYPP